ncbi:unnamed protein product [Musa acuminata subsp. burmannicoides]
MGSLWLWMQFFFSLIRLVAEQAKISVRTKVSDWRRKKGLILCQSYLLIGHGSSLDLFAYLFCALQVILSSRTEESNNHVVSEERYPSKDSQRASSAVCELSSIVPLFSFLFLFPTLTIAIICARSYDSQQRKKFGLLEKHKDYVLRARAFHQKEDTLRRLREKAASRNPDEFYFKMVNTRMVDGIHRPKSEANKYTPEELMLMKTQDIGYVLQKVQSEKKKIERLNSALHTLDHQPENKHVYYAEDREEVKEIQSRQLEKQDSLTSVKVPGRIKKKTAASYRELEARQKRVQNLEKLYSDMALQKELQKSGRKRRLREDEIVQPTSRPVYKWRTERKR